MKGLVPLGLTRTRSNLTVANMSRIRLVPARNEFGFLVPEKAT